jgi:hypothetical protein
MGVSLVLDGGVPLGGHYRAHLLEEAQKQFKLLF